MTRRLTHFLAAPLMGSLVLALPVRADDHLVSSSDVAIRLAEAASKRQADLSTLNSFLASPTGQQAAKMLGADSAALTPRLAHLGDSEARDLANRARTLTADPAAAGLNGWCVPVIVLGAIELAGLAFLVLLILLGGD